MNAIILKLITRLITGDDNIATA